MQGSKILGYDVKSKKYFEMIFDQMFVGEIAEAFEDTEFCTIAYKYFW
jgi:hypothetical protein